MEHYQTIQPNTYNKIFYTAATITLTTLTTQIPTDIEPFYQAVSYLVGTTGILLSANEAKKQLFPKKAHK